ncbi:MAG: outer membrane beta-barrel protein [Candidatus Krumholzibacteriia bacterium]
MKSFLVTAVIISLFAANAIAQPQQDPERDSNERLGVRIGYLATTSDLENSFGDGVDLALHWVQKIRNPFAIDFTLGVFLLGDTGRDDITRSFIFPPPTGDISMRVLTFTAAPVLAFPVNDRTDFYVSAGVGLYTISLLLESGLFQGETSDNHLGVNGGSGLTRRISTNWYLDLNLQLHKFWTSTNSDDLFFVYSEGDQDPLFYNVTVGFLLRLF